MVYFFDGEINSQDVKKGIKKSIVGRKKDHGLQVKHFCFQSSCFTLQFCAAIDKFVHRDLKRWRREVDSENHAT